MARFRVHHYALIGALLGLLPTLRSTLFYFLHGLHDPSRGYTEAQFVWAALERAVPEIVVGAVLGAVVGILVVRRRRSTDLAGVRNDGLPGTDEQWLADRRTFLLINGLLITTFLLWASPRLLLAPSLGVATAWVITRVGGWRCGAGVLLLGGLLGNVVHFRLGGLNQLMSMVSYLTHWGGLGILVALGFSTVQVLGPTLLVLGLTSPHPSKRAAP